MYVKWKTLLQNYPAKIAHDHHKNKDFIALISLMRLLLSIGLNKDSLAHT